MSKKAEKVIQTLSLTRQKFWNIHPDSAKVLIQHIDICKPKKILEIGTSNGLSAILMGDRVSRYGGTVTAVEYFADRVEIARANIRKSGLEDVVQVLQGDALVILPSLAEKWDFVFIDAGKKDYLNFYNIVVSKMSDNAMLVADNTVSHLRYMTDFLNVIMRDDRFDVREYSTGDGLLVAKKK